MSETVHIHGSCCPVINTLDIIDGKRKVLILCYLSSETRHSNELQRLLAGITQRMLTLQLRELEDNGIVHREAYPQVPLKVEYLSTELGRTLMPTVEAIHRWDEQHAAEYVKHKKQSQAYAFMVMILIEALGPSEQA